MRRSTLLPKGTQMSPTTSASVPSSQKQARAAALSGFLGSTLEYYDFFIYGSAAALVLGKLYFPGNGASATLLSFSTVAVSYIARPLGAIILGHFGDKLGRKNVLLMTLVIMGGSTFLIGCLPTYSMIGFWAPALLVALRLIQGLSAGGESPGSSSLSMEHAPERRRGFFVSWTMTGITLGIVLSSLVFVPVTMLPDSALLSWGWRVPFWLSILVTGLAYIIRRYLSEPAVFEAVKEHGETANIPFIELFHSDWRGVVRVMICAVITMVNTIFTVFALSFATSTEGLSKSGILSVIALANLLSAAMTPVFGHMSDRMGRKPLFIVGCIGSAVMVFPFFASLESHNWGFIYLTALLLTGIFYTMPNAIYPVYFPELFPARIRYSGMAIGLMLGLIVAGFTPAISGALTASNPSNWLPVAIFTAACCVAAAVSAFTGRETYKTPTARLGLTVKADRGPTRPEAVVGE